MPPTSSPQDLPRHPAYIRVMNLPPLTEAILITQMINWKEREWVGLDLHTLSERGGFAPAVKNDAVRAAWVTAAMGLGAIPFADELAKGMKDGTIELDGTSGAIYLTDKGVNEVRNARSRLPSALKVPRTHERLQSLDVVAGTGLDASRGHSDAIRFVIRLLAATEVAQPGSTWIGLNKAALLQGQIVAGMPLDKGRQVALTVLTERVLRAHGRLSSGVLSGVITDMQNRRLVAVIADTLFLDDLGHKYIAGAIR